MSETGNKQTADPSSHFVGHGPSFGEYFTHSAVVIPFARIQFSVLSIMPPLHPWLHSPSLEQDLSQFISYPTEPIMFGPPLMKSLSAVIPTAACAQHDPVLPTISSVEYVWTDHSCPD